MSIAAILTLAPSMPIAFSSSLLSLKEMGAV